MLLPTLFNWSLKGVQDEKVLLWVLMKDMLMLEFQILRNKKNKGNYLEEKVRNLSGDIIASLEQHLKDYYQEKHSETIG